jgi:uncharacterized protein YcbX
MKAGIVKEIWRYPVKGMAGEQVEQCAIGPSGLDGDRIWALRDVARKEIQSCKFRPELLSCSATTRKDSALRHVDIALPDNLSSASDDPGVHRALSELVGYHSTLEKLQPVEALDFYRRHKTDDTTWLDELKATFTREPGEPLPDFSQMPQQARDFVTVPGTFFLVTPFHIITSATLNHMKSLLPEADWDVRRFRPNIVIETSDSDKGLVEQGWIGRRMRIAESRIDCTATAPRCGAVTRQQQELGFDKSMLRTIISEAEQNLGIYGSISNQATLAVGDTVYIE